MNRKLLSTWANMIYMFAPKWTVETFKKVIVFNYVQNILAIFLASSRPVSWGSDASNFIGSNQKGAQYHLVF